MHIPDGMLSPATCGVCGAVMLPVWTLAARKTRTALKSRQVTLLAALSAFSFTVMLYNVPVLGGTTAHAVGGTLLAIALGPWAAVLGITVALAIQALLFADGGILSFGANCLVMAFIGPFIGYAVYRALSAGGQTGYGRRTLASAVGAYIGLNASALAVALLLGLQPHLAVGPDGKPLYFPFDLSATLPGILLPHLLVAGLIEGAVTASGCAYLMRAHRGLVENAAGGMATNNAHCISRLYAVLVALIVLAPLGLLAPGSAWGEWATGDIVRMTGYVPQGMAQMAAGAWKTPLADYQLAASGGDTLSFLHSALGYYVCAVVGVGAILGLAALLGRLLSSREGTSGA